MEPSKFKKYQKMERIIKVAVSQQGYHPLPWCKFMMRNETVTNSDIKVRGKILESC